MHFWLTGLCDALTSPADSAQKQTFDKLRAPPQATVATGQQQLSFGVAEGLFSSWRKGRRLPPHSLRRAAFGLCAV